jgi:hypothetical protein
MSTSGNGKPNNAALWIAIAALLLSVVSLVSGYLQEQSNRETAAQLAQTQSAISEQTGHIAETQNAMIIPVMKVDSVQMDADSPTYTIRGGSFYLSCSYGIRLENRGGASGRITTYGASVMVGDKVMNLNVDDPANDQNAQLFGNTTMEARSFAISSRLPDFSAETAFNPKSLTDMMNNKIFPAQIDAYDFWDFVIYVGFKTGRRPPITPGDNDLKISKESTAGAVPLTVIFSFQVDQQGTVTSDPVECGYARAR